MQTENETEVKGLIDALGLQEKQQYVRIYFGRNSVSEICFPNNIKQFFFHLFSPDDFFLFLAATALAL